MFVGISKDVLGMNYLKNIRLVEILTAAFAVLALAGNTHVKPGDDFISAMTKASAGDTVFFEAVKSAEPFRWSVSWF